MVSNMANRIDELNNRSDENELYDDCDLWNDWWISNNGFLPEFNYTSLPANFKCFQQIVDRLDEKKSDSQTFRQMVDELPEYDEQYSTRNLSVEQMMMMYSILTMCVNRYIWCSGINDAKKYNVIRSTIAVPLYEIAKKMGITISLTHASVDLWNWRKKRADDPISLENLEILRTMTGSSDEEWFYKIMIVIEGLAGEVLRMINRSDLYFDGQIGDYDQEVVQMLHTIKKTIDRSIETIRRMYEHCDPDFFFKRLRIYLSGSDNDNLPEGVLLDLRPIKNSYHTIRYKGGSAAQSTLIQVYDEFFGIKHDGHSGDYLDLMKQYMPAKHREFLRIVSIKPSIKDYVEMSNNPEVVQVFNECVRGLTTFRQVHIGLVHRYIMRFVGPSDEHCEEVKDQHDVCSKNAHGTKGSGGTDPVEFCTEIIKDTRKSFVPFVARQNGTSFVLPKCLMNFIKRNQYELIFILIVCIMTAFDKYLHHSVE
jgi:indoleamine 2,3-dioxygenase